MRIMLLMALMAVAMLTACNATPTEDPNEIKPAADVNAPPKTGAEKIADEFPVDQYPGSTIQVSSRKGLQRMTMLTSKADYGKIVQYYKDFFTNQRWSVLTIDENPTESSIVATKGKEKLSVEVTTNAEGGNAGTVTILLTKEPLE